MNNQQGPFNSPFFPKMGERETEPSENTKSANPNGRLGHKTSLRGLRQQNTGPMHTSFSADNAVNNGEQSFAPSQQSWGTNGQQSFMPPQQPWNNPGLSATPQQSSWNEMATQAFQDAQQPWNEAGAQGFHSSPAQPAQRTPSGQLGHGSSLFNNPMFPRNNNQQWGNAGTPANNIQTGPNPPVNGSPSGMHPNATRNLGNSGTFRSPTGALGNSGMHSDATQNLSLVPSPTGALGNTGTLMHPAGEYSGDTGMLKLNQAVKVVRIPIPGKPG
ncbi:hypothetical protein, partial [Dictyobacter formicarum]|uniref:hypothetical protein n=1 Tax=Dictyobacter formicarum TaxID=2778368 RepID=UPI0019156127